MRVQVRSELIGSRLYRLLITIDGVYVGEYERSQEADIARKTLEIDAAQGELLDLFQKNGPLTVRWNRKDREKTVRRSDGVRVGAIPPTAWRTPSWAVK